MTGFRPCPICGAELTLKLADGSAFALTETYTGVSSVMRDVKDGKWVRPDIRDRRSSTGEVHMHINPKQVCRMEHYAEGEEVWKTGWTYTEARR